MSLRTAILCLAAAGALSAADLPYAGKWKMNPAKSNLAGTAVTYQKLAGGEWQATADGNTYKFKMDGAENPDGLGDTAAWKMVDGNTWQTVWKTNGKVVGTDTLRLGQDGMLTVTSKGTHPNGEAFEDTAVLQRVSGSGGLEGKWKTKSVQMSSAMDIELAPNGANGLTYKQPAENLTCEGQLDGKDYPCTGPTVPAGWTSTLKKSGARSLDVVVKKDGKPMYRYTYTASLDGKTLEVSGLTVATGEKTKMVFDRQ